MSWQAVARKDFQDASRSYLLWGLTGVFVLLVSMMAVTLGYLRNDPTSTDVIGSIHLLFQYVVPLIAIMIAFGSIVGERDSGSLKILLSLPHSREDVVVGKVLGRSVAFVIPLILGLTLPAIGMLIAGVDFEPVKYVGYIVLTALFGIAFVSISTGVSASSGSRFRVLLTLIGFYFVFNILWRIINSIGPFTLILISGQWPSWMPMGPQETIQAFQLLSPTGDFHLLKQALFNDILFASEVPQGMPGLSTQIGAISILLLWIFAPMALGMWRFDEADL